MRALHLFAPSAAAQLIDAARSAGDAAAFVEEAENGCTTAPWGLGEQRAARQAAERAAGRGPTRSTSCLRRYAD